MPRVCAHKKLCGLESLLRWNVTCTCGQRDAQLGVGHAEMLQFAVDSFIQFFGSAAPLFGYFSRQPMILLAQQTVVGLQLLQLGVGVLDPGQLVPQIHYQLAQFDGWHFVFAG